MKKLLIVLALCGLTVQITSCKAKNAQGDAELVDNADVAKIEAEDDFGGTPDGKAQEETVTDESLQAALGETPNTDPATPAPEVSASTDAPAPEIAAAPQLDELTLSDNSNAAPADPAAANLATDPAMAEATGITETPIVETPAETTAPVADAPILTPEPGNEVAAAKVETAPVVAPKSSLKKLSEIVPYQEGEGWVNTVYIARPKETLKQISQKIYSADKTKELKAINTSLKSRAPRAGERIYYVSPNRPMDSSKTITFFEDSGMMPESYVAQKGDNLRTVAKKLLGYDGAWRELWITNPVESQGKLAEGEILRYYKTTAAVPPAEMVAANNPPAMNTPPPMEAPPMPPPQQELPPPTMAQNTPPPMPDQNMAPPPPDMNAQANMAPPPPQELPPPPPPTEPPPPPPPPMETAQAPTPPADAGTTEEGGEDAGLIMGLDQTQLALAAVVLIGLVAIVMMRARKKKKEAELAAMSETNVI